MKSLKQDILKPLLLASGFLFIIAVAVFHLKNPLLVLPPVAPFHETSAPVTSARTESSPIFPVSGLAFSQTIQESLNLKYGAGIKKPFEETWARFDSRPEVGLSLAEPGAAVRRLTEELARDPGNPDILFYRALAYLSLSEPLDGRARKGFRKLALQDLNKALTIDPFFGDALYERAELLMTEPKPGYAGAQRDLTAALRFGGARVEAEPAFVLVLRGRCFLALKRLDAAAEDFLAARRQNPMVPDVHRFEELAGAYEKQGRWKAAEKFRRMILEENLTSARLGALARNLQGQGRDREAGEVLLDKALFQDASGVSSRFFSSVERTAVEVE